MVRAFVQTLCEFEPLQTESLQVNFVKSSILISIYRVCGHTIGNKITKTQKNGMRTARPRTTLALFEPSDVAQGELKMRYCS